MWVAGADGCRAGWLVVLHDVEAGRQCARLLPRFRDVLALPERPQSIAVDMPIGLLDHAEPGGRECDRAARRVLGRPRSSSVFSPPVRGALREGDYASAQRRNQESSSHAIGLSRQAFGIAPKIRELDACMTPSRQRRVREAHPELAFAELFGSRGTLSGKRTPRGRKQRLRLLLLAGFRDARSLLTERPRGAAIDDVLDACVLCWAAVRVRAGEARRLPHRPLRDARGLRMEIWY
jgi:predicted RNase H-like nuclease